MYFVKKTNSFGKCSVKWVIRVGGVPIPVELYIYIYIYIDSSLNETTTKLNLYKQREKNKTKQNIPTRTTTFVSILDSVIYPPDIHGIFPAPFQETPTDSQ